MKRLFVVGIARSGTTLLQSLIGSHDAVETFPETHFFSKTVRKEPVLRFLHRVTPGHRERVREFLDSIDKGRLYRAYSGGALSLNGWAAYLLGVLDSLAEDANKTAWLEKTPMHLHYVDLIERNCDGVHFIHMVREPVATVAALYDVSRRHPDRFAQDTLEKAISRYRREIKLSESHLHKANHQAVHYEELLDDPETTLRRLCAGVDLPFQESMLAYSETAAKVTQKDEDWKAKNTRGMSKEDKVSRRLTPEELTLVEAEMGKIRSPLLEYYG